LLTSNAYLPLFGIFIFRVLFVKDISQSILTGEPLNIFVVDN
jgi:hypothetical protein